LTFDLTVGRTPALVATAIALIVYLVLWVGIPLRAAFRGGDNQDR
jgi:hypothetical protein